MEFILEKGFDGELGARPLQRAIQRNVEDMLAEQFLLSEFVEGDTISIVVKEDELTVIKENSITLKKEDSELSEEE